MVTPQQALIAQQQASRQPTVTTSLKIQQQALREGKSVAQVQREIAIKEQTKFEARQKTQQEKLASDRASIEGRLKEIEQEKTESSERTRIAFTQDDISGRRKEQGIQLGLNSERSSLNEALSALKQGFGVNVSQALKQSSQVGTQTRKAEVSRISDIEGAERDFKREVKEQTGVSFARLSRTLGSEAQARAFLQGRGTINQTQFDKFSPTEQRGLGKIGIKFEEIDTPFIVQEQRITDEVVDVSPTFFVGEVQPVPEPKGIRERVARFRSNIFGRFITQQQTGREGIEAEEIFGAVFKGTTAARRKVTETTKKGLEKIPGFEGFTTETLFRPERIVEADVPQFGTVTLDAPTGFISDFKAEPAFGPLPEFDIVTPSAPTGFVSEQFIIPEKPVKEFKIFEPEKVAEGVGIGLELGVISVIPPTILAPSFIFEGGKTFLDPEATPTQKLIGAGEVALGAGIGLKGAFNLIRETNRASNVASTLATKTKVPNKVVQSFDVSDAILTKTLPNGNKIFNVEGEVVTKIVNAKTGKTINKLSTDTVSEVITARTKSGAIRAFVRSTSQTISDTARRVSRVEPKVTISGTLEKTKGNVVFFPLEEGKGFVGVGAFETTDLGKIFGRVTRKGKVKIKKDKDGILGGIEEDPFLKIDFVATRTPQVTKTRSFLEVKPLKDEFVVKKIEGIDFLGRRTTGEATSFDIIFPQTVKVKGFTRIRKTKEGILGGIEKVPTKGRKFPRRKGGKPQIVREIGAGRGVGSAFEPTEIISNLDKLTEGVIPKLKRTKRPPKGKIPPKTRGDQLEQALTGTEESLIGGALGQQFTGAVAKQIKAKALIKARAVPKPRIKTKVKDAVGVKDITGLEVGLVSVVSPDITGKQELDKGLIEEDRQEFGLLPAVIQQPSFDVTAKEDVAQSRESRTIQASLQELTQAVDLSKPTFIPVPPFFGEPIPKQKKIPVPIPRPRRDEDPRVRKIRRSKDPFNVFVKSKGKVIKVADHVKGDIALDIGSLIVDKSLSAQFSIKKVKGKIKKPSFQPPKDYWDFNKNKFDNFRRKAGRKIPLKNAWIEKQNRRLDSRNERDNIVALKFLSQQKKKANQRLLTNKNFNNIFGNPMGNNPSPKKKKSTRKAPKKQNKRKQKNMLDVPFNLI